MSVSTKVPEQAPELTAEDRCDRCGAQAYLRVKLPSASSELLFCAHHSGQHKSALKGLKGVIMTDETYRLTES